MKLTLVDLVLHAAATCHLCRSLGRPVDLTDHEQGDQFRHPVANQKTDECRADQIWALIRKLEDRS